MSKSPGAAPRIVALVGDLMDRSRIAAAVGDVRFVASVDEIGPADGVVVDLGRFGAAVTEIRGRFPHARIVAFGSHVDRTAIAAAADAGADLVLARSRFFADPAAAIDDAADA
ncbi:MAG: DNA-binding response regulator [Acidimicrobiia bacterium]